MSRWYLLNHQTFCLQSWYWDASLWVWVLFKKVDLLFSNSRSLQDLIWSKYDNSYCIFWTADLFAIKLGLVVYYHKTQCFMEKLDCYAQGQGHNEHSECGILPNLVWWCIIMSQIVFQNDWFAVLKVKVTVKDNMIKI